MRIFILSRDLSGTGPVWLNILWPEYNAIKEGVDCDLVSVPNTQHDAGNFITKRYNKWNEYRKNGDEIRDSIRANLDPEGQNLLIVWAGTVDMIEWANVIAPISSVFNQKILQIYDAIEPKTVPVQLSSQFDLITCFCQDRAWDFEKETGIETLYLPFSCDVLNFHCVDDYRPIDMLVVGRRNKEIHKALTEYFMDPKKRRFILDFNTRTQRYEKPPGAEEEFKLLMSAHDRASVTFCWETSDMPRLGGTSPLLSRWIHSWASGCMVFGTRPKGSGTQDLFDWDGSIFELSGDPDEAIYLIEQCLQDSDQMAKQRVQNVIETLRRHDTRYRLRDLMLHLDLPISDRLQQGLNALNARANELEESYAELVA